MSLPTTITCGREEVAARGVGVESRDDAASMAGDDQERNGRVPRRRRGVLVLRVFQVVQPENVEGGTIFERVYSQRMRISLLGLTSWNGKRGQKA